MNIFQQPPKMGFSDRLLERFSRATPSIAYVAQTAKSKRHAWSGYPDGKTKEKPPVPISARRKYQGPSKREANDDRMSRSQVGYEASPFPFPTSLGSVVYQEGCQI
jgi:hypothetical protein